MLACIALLAMTPAARAQSTSPTTSPSLSASGATPEQRAAAIVSPAVVYLEQYWTAWVKVPKSSGLYFYNYVNDGQPFQWGTRCSGFVANPDGYVVTAGHCVDPGEEGARDEALRQAVQWLIDNGWAYKRDFQYWLDEAHLSWTVEGQEAGSDPDLEIRVQRGTALSGRKASATSAARVVDYQPWSEGDVALLKIEEGDLPTLLLASSSDIAIGTEVLSVGYPGSTDAVTDQSLDPTFKDGQINAQKTREGGLLPVYEMSAALSGGMSGGPTVNMAGDVVGVNSFNISGETEAFNFITPSSLVSEMMARNGVTNELGPVDQAYRAGVEAYYTGDYQTAIDRFDEVLALSPSHKQAQELKVEATKALQAQPSPTGGQTEGTTSEGGGIPTLAIVGIAVAVLVILGLVFVMSRRKKAPVAPAPAQPLQAVAAPQAPASEAARAVGFQPTPAAVPPQAEAPPPPQAEAPAAPQAAPVPPQAAPEPPQPAPTPPQAAPSAQPQAGGEHPHFCPNCGFKLEPDAHFCPSCGQKLA
jgi:S1-C subfamily serine protease